MQIPTWDVMFLFPLLRIMVYSHNHVLAQYLQKLVTNSLNRMILAEVEGPFVSHRTDASRQSGHPYITTSM